MPGVPVNEEEIEGIQVHRWIRSSETRDPGSPSPSSLQLPCRRFGGLHAREGIRHPPHPSGGLWEGVAAGVARSGLLWGVPTLVQPASSGYYGEAEELARTRGASLLRRLILRNDGFVAISADIAHQWRALGVPSSRLVRISSGVDGRHFRPGPSRLEADLPPRPRVVFTGRLHPQKNLDVLIDAWPTVAATTGANLILVGQGPSVSVSKPEPRPSKDRRPHSFCGPCPRRWPECTSRRPMFSSLPSVAEAGMSNSLLEAMATALPCVASDIGGNHGTRLLGPGPAVRSRQ